MDIITLTSKLDGAVRAVCPIDGISIGDPAFRATWNVAFSASATPQQRAAAMAIIAALDVTLPDLLVAIDVERDRRLKLGFADPVTGKTFQADESSITLLTAIGAGALAAIISGAPQTVIKIIPFDNTTDFKLSATDTVALLSGRMMPWVSAMRFNARDMKNRAIAGGPVDINSGWPPP